MPASPLTIFGIRHHGPGSARSLCRALEALQPDILLVEGPPDADDLLPWVAHADLQPPVALLVYAAENPRQAVYYPFAVFSPEWQAIQYGLRRSLPVRFMDLPQGYQLSVSSEPVSVGGKPESEDQVSGKQEANGSLPPSLAPLSPDPLSPISLDPLRWIAETTGYSDPERFWEHLVEQRRQDRDLFAAILELMEALRQEVEQLPEASPPPAGEDIEACREAHMRQAIRAAQGEGFQRIAAVCGAWHAPALRPDHFPAKADAGRLKNLPRVKTAAAWVPWSYGRLAWESGYGAGLESPGWYDALWQAGENNLSPTEVTIRWMAQVAHLLRGEDLSASSAHVIEAVRLAESLAALRNRPLPGLPELNEATRAVFCFGDDLPLRLIREKLIVSERLGHVPAEAPMTPLHADLAAQQKRLRLPAEASFRDLDLDLRNPTDLGRSYLLHRLDILHIPWGQMQRLSGKSGTFHELWRLQWQPELAVRAVEASLWGNTVAEAAAAFIRHTAEQAEDLPALTGLVGGALLADLPDAVGALLARLDTAAALASDTGQLMDALPPLAEVLRYGNVRQTDTEMVAGVVGGLIARICVGLPAACASLNNDAAAEMFTRLMAVQRAVGLLQDPAHQQPWQATLATLADQAGLHGLLAGRACALLLEGHRFTAEEVSRRLGLALSTANEPAHAAAWVEGLLKGSGALLVHDDTLWQIIADWVAALPEETFTPLLPLLRRTFSTFTPPERRALGERARHGGQAPAAHRPSAADFDEGQAEAVLAVVGRLLGIQLTSEKTA